MVTKKKKKGGEKKYLKDRKNWKEILRHQDKLKHKK